MVGCLQSCELNGIFDSRHFYKTSSCFMVIIETFSPEDLETRPTSGEKFNAKF